MLPSDDSQEKQDTERIDPLEHEKCTEEVNAALISTPTQAVEEICKENQPLQHSGSHVITHLEKRDRVDAVENQASSEEQGGHPSQPSRENACKTSPRRKTKSLMKLDRLKRPTGIKRHTGIKRRVQLCRPIQLKLSSLSNGSNNAKEYLKRGQSSCTQPAHVGLKKAMACTARKTLSTSKVLHLRNSLVQIKFQQVLPVPRNVKEKRARREQLPLHKPFRQKRRCVERAAQQTLYPELVGKRIRHLYEENDKSEAWYQGLVVGIYQQHPNPLKTVYEVRYDSEPKWRYYLELLQDFENGWLELDE